MVWQSGHLLFDSLQVPMFIRHDMKVNEQVL